MEAEDEEADNEDVPALLFSLLLHTVFPDAQVSSAPSAELTAPRSARWSASQGMLGVASLEPAHVLPLLKGSVATVWSGAVGEGGWWV